MQIVYSNFFFGMQSRMELTYVAIVHSSGMQQEMQPAIYSTLNEWSYLVLMNISIITS